MAVYYKSAQNYGPVNYLLGNGPILGHFATARMSALALQAVHFRQVSLEQAYNSSTPQGFPLSQMLVPV